MISVASRPAGLLIELCEMDSLFYGPVHPESSVKVFA
jgi:hypothetical protein